VKRVKKIKVRQFWTRNPITKVKESSKLYKREKKGKLQYVNDD